MGTRGTLRVYLNGELKVRQYNQWDSNPTGQFAGICDFMSHPANVDRLVWKLRESRFYTEEETERMNSCWDTWGFKDLDDFEFGRVLNFIRLADRDLGSSVLYAIAALYKCTWKDDGEWKRGYLLPDWAEIFDVDDLGDEEGNYVIDIIDIEGEPPRFILKGEWHGVEMSFAPDEIPDLEVLQGWELRADAEGGDGE